MPAKINIGCGFDIREGYLNVDSGAWHRPDLIADVTDLSMLPSEHFEEAVAQDVLEHLGRTQQVETLTSWARLLRHGGLLRVRVPSAIDMVRLLDAHAFRIDLSQQHYWVQMLYGTQAYPGDFHLCGYTYLTLVDLGRQAGLWLSDITLKDRWLFDTTFKKVAGLDEFTSREWLAYHYMNELQRIPDEAGLAYWTDQLQTGQYSRMQVLHEFAKSRLVSG